MKSELENRVKGLHPAPNRCALVAFIQKGLNHTTRFCSGVCGYVLVTCDLGLRGDSKPHRLFVDVALLQVKFCTTQQVKRLGFQCLE
ncbi:MAG: hypothetical protein NXH74_15035 [Rhodobacteraceae bacterium]|jgi:hypothetical protein|nr:hypothetical protein [Paracoccaceae bacterium]